MSIAEYFRMVKSLADTLAVIGKRLEDDEVISYLLGGLGSEYESLVISLTTRNDVFTINDVYAHMLSHELRIQKNTGGS
jgi:hypothetical protein